MQSPDGPETRQLPLNKATSFNVYQPTTLSLAKGDLIQFTQNTVSTNSQRRISNGTQARIVGINQRTGRIHLASLKGHDRYEISADNGFFRHGYCITSHAAQGKTVDRVIMSQGTESLPAISPEQLYVSASRGRCSVGVYANSITDLEQRVISEYTQLSITNYCLPLKARQQR